MNVQDIDLNVSKERSSSKVVRIGQGDKGGTTIRATIRDGAVAATLTGLTAKFLMKTPGGGYVEDVHVNVSGSTLTYVVDEEHCASTAGTTDECYFQILDGTTVRYSTERFTMRIYRSATQGADPAQSYSDDIVAATQAARDAADAAEAAMQDIGTAVEDAAAAAESAAQAVTDAQTAIADADTAKQQATTAANTATAAANNANDKATAANNAASSANTAAGTANDASARAEAAISAMGDISEQAVPLMSPDTRGGAKLGDGLAVDDGKLHVGALAKASTGEVYGPLASVSAKGWAEQASTTGKNLLDADNANRATYVNYTFANNALTVVSTSTNTWSYAAYIIPCAENQTYTLSFNESGMLIYVEYLNASNERIDGVTRTSTVTFTTPSGCASIAIWFYARASSSGQVGDSMTYTNPQLELGSTATEFEPYSGGLPSPRPNWEQPIKVVRGRNLLDTSQLIMGSIDSNGNLTVITTNYARTPKISVKPNTEYVVHTTYATNQQILIYEWVDDDTFLGRSDYSKTSSATSAPFTTKPTTAQVVVMFRHVSTPPVLADFAESQLELGSTPHPYVPYGHVGLEVQGKNLLDADNANRATYANYTFANNALTVVSTSTNTWSYVAYIIPCAENQSYTFSFNESNRNIFVEYLDASNTRITGITRTSTVTFTTPSGCASIAIWFYARARSTGQIGDSMTYTNPQLELGSTATAYEPYHHHTTTPIPLPSRGWVAGLPDGTADTLRLDGAGHVEWTLPTSEVVLDGTEAGWVSEGSYASTGGGFYAIYTKTNAIGLEVTESNTLCQELSKTNLGSASDLHGVIGFMAASGSVLRVRAYESTSAQDLVTFKSWLSSHQLTVLSALATPTTEGGGYVDMPEISWECQVSIPELESFGCTFWVDEDGSIRAAMREWYERAHSEYADRIQALEEAVAELATS